MESQNDKNNPNNMTTTALPNIHALTLENTFSESSFKNVSDSELAQGGYHATEFSGKQQQMEKVMDAIDASGLVPEALIEQEVAFFYQQLGIEDTYFASESIDNIASNILALYSAKVAAEASGEEATFVHHKKITDDHAVYFETGNDNVFEKEIDDQFFDNTTDASTYRMESFNSTLTSGESVKCHFVYKNDFTKVDAGSSIDSISDNTFAKIASTYTKTLYSEVLQELDSTEGPVIKHYTLAANGEVRIVIGFKRGTSQRYNSALSTLAKYYGITINRKYIENFSDGHSIISMYLSNTNGLIGSDITTFQLTKEASLLYTVPNNKFYYKFESGEWSIQECIYAHCGVIFVSHFLNRLGPEFQSLKELLLTSASPKNLELVSKIKERFTSETFSESYIIETVDSNAGLVRQLFKNFVDVHYTSKSIVKTLSYQRVAQVEGIHDDDHFEKLLSDVPFNSHQLVLRALYSFNKSILKTNFFITSKIALSFRLDASFLPKTEYPNTPYGMFFIVGSDFRGFHIRFKDVARGGIRIVLSRSQDAYLKNMRSMFDENYNLASTQQRKNKDIPEGGSKGVILVNQGSAQSNYQDCFVKYIDSILDLLIKDPAKEQIVDLYGKPEMIYMGPDENTAGFVDWATLHAKKRGASLGFPWKAFFTGKSPTIGGIPHDEYGMTTLSVRAFTKGVYSKMGVEDWSKIHKVQMAGGDGDLGSNEIKLSGNETYVGICDGAGVIVDEDGIDKDELLRLAKERKANDHFDQSKLGPKGYAIMIDQNNIKLPNGEIVKSGLQFRNQFHLKLQSIYPPNFVQLFTPCGGRPNSIDANTVHYFLDPKTGKSIVPIIIEGANLFITQAAKLILEDAGCTVFKDASTNKGGVTSSSLEVLAALSFDDESFAEHMCQKSNGEVPEFYKSYVKQVQEIIVKNANDEFEMMWKLKNETGKPFSTLSDELSLSINKLADELSSSKELWEDDEVFRNLVLKRALPSLLLEKIGLDSILERVPVAYLKAIFATKLASEFVYSRGIDANPAKFLEFVSSIKKHI